MFCFLFFVLAYKTLKETVNSYVPKVAAHLNSFLLQYFHNWNKISSTMDSDLRICSIAVAWMAQRCLLRPLQNLSTNNTTTRGTCSRSPKLLPMDCIYLLGLARSLAFSCMKKNIPLSVSFINYPWLFKKWPCAGNRCAAA